MENDSFKNGKNSGIFQVTVKHTLNVINPHNGILVVQEAPLPWCQNLLLPNTREWLFYGRQGKYGLESYCRLHCQDSLLPAHYKESLWYLELICKLIRIANKIKSYPCIIDLERGLKINVILEHAEKSIYKCTNCG